MRIALAAFASVAVLPAAALADGDYQLVPLKDREHELLIETSHELEGYFAAQGLIHPDDEIVALVRRIGNELAPSLTDDYVRYRFFVLRDPSPNAFALPNGDVYVHSGMLARLRDESQLAALLAHEINHVAGHHGIVDYRATRKKQIAGMVLGGLGGWGGVISVALQTSVYGFSRELEQEADDRAAALLLDSRFDPHALPEVFDILGTDYEGLNPRTPSVWSTHPEIRARAETSRALVEDMPARERQEDAFEIAVFRLRVMTIQDYIQDDYPHTAIALAETMLERYPDEPRLLHVLGDAWQAMGAQEPLEAESLSNADKRRNVRARVRKTREQRLAELLETEAGRAAYATNRSRAEQSYLRAIDVDPDYALAYRGLGEVYEQQQRDRDAAEAYLKYVRAVPEAVDRAIVIRRLEAIGDRLKQGDAR